MSSILKALEKAEETSNPRRLANDSGVIRSNKSRPGWVTPVAVLCAAGVAALVTYGAMGGFSKKPAHPAAAVVKTGPVVVAPLRPVPETVQVPERVVQPEQPNQGNGSQANGSQAGQAAPAATEPAAAAPPAAAAAPKAKAAPAAPPRSLAVPVKIAPPMNANAVVPVKKAVPVSGAKAVAPKLGASQPVAVQPTALQASPRVAAPAPAPVAAPAPAPAPAPAKAAAAAPAASSAPARAQLKVSGIAYQDNGEASFAVVNGRAVLQGGSVDGYKVLEIRHDSVKFSGGNSTFEIPLEVEEK